MTTRRLLLSVLLTACASVGWGAEVSVDFPTQVIPVLTRHGCNAGACHGAAIGRGGFKLSLYGGDPTSDYRAIVQHREGRRINLADPQQSLLLLKPTELLEHGGGQRLEADSRSGQLILRWIAEGAGAGGTRVAKKLHVQPTTFVVSKPGQRVPLRAEVEMTDGSRRDVTEFTVFKADDPASITVDEDASSAGVQRPGQHIVIARYLNHVVPIQLILPLGKPAQDTEENRIDSDGPSVDLFIDQRLNLLALSASPAADDRTLIRRLHLDLTGRLPAAEAVRAYVASSDPDKYTKLVGNLIESTSFVDFWTFQLAELLRIRSQPKDTRGAQKFHGWLRQQVAKRTSYRTLVTQLVTAEGDSHEIGPANFYRVTRGAREQAEYVSELLMGVRLRCANCHNHPLDRWTQDDYHGLAAVFAGVEQGRVIRVNPRGKVTHPRTGEAATPSLPGGGGPLASGRDPRAQLADWLTSSENPYLSRAFVNRIWKRLMGRGLVEPEDDLRATNPPTHPRLLQFLATDFDKHGDLRQTIVTIVNSRAYRRSSKPTEDNADDDRFYSHWLARPLGPHVFLDAVGDVTGIPEQFDKQPDQTRAVTLFDSRIASPALDILGRCGRDATCDSNSNRQAGLALKLHLINGTLINSRLTSPQGQLQRWLREDVGYSSIADRFFLQCLSRPPTAIEKRRLNKFLEECQSNKQRVQVLEDLVWSLLTCREFTQNH